MHNHASFIDQNGLYTHIRRGPPCRAEWNLTWNQRFKVETRDTMPEQLPLFEIRMRKRGRACRRYLCTIEGHVVMQGSEGSRSVAKYQARRALFLMLLASATDRTGSAIPAGLHRAETVHQLNENVRTYQHSTLRHCSKSSPSGSHLGRKT